EVHAHRGPVEASAQGNRVDEPVGADLAGIVVADRHAGLQARTDDEHLVPEIALGHGSPFGLQVGHGGGDDRAGEVREGDAAQLQEVAERGPKLVGGGLAHGGKAPVLDQVIAAEGAEVGLGVADVDDEEHGEDYGPSAPLLHRCPLSRTLSALVGGPTRTHEGERWAYAGAREREALHGAWIAPVRGCGGGAEAEV